MKSPAIRQIPNRKTLQIIAGALDRVRDHFIWEGVAELPDNDADFDMLSSAGPPLSGEPESSDDDSYREPPVESFDQEEVEIAIDAFLSGLFRKKVIRKDKSGNLPSFSGVFEEVFGEKHAIVEIAASFEDHVAGYFGWIDCGNMKTAYNEFLEIQDLLKKALGMQGD